MDFFKGDKVTIVRAKIIPFCVSLQRAADERKSRNARRSQGQSRLDVTSQDAEAIALSLP